MSAVKTGKVDCKVPRKIAGPGLVFNAHDVKHRGHLAPIISQIFAIIAVPPGVIATALPAALFCNCLLLLPTLDASSLLKTQLPEAR